MARAASTTPGSDATRFCSTTRPITTPAISAIGRIAAVVPMVVPMTISVSGAMAVMKMMNGMGLMMFTRKFRNENTALLANRFPGLVA
ncbi:hypothetical protein D3C78_1686510 [compost metagenome]